jgi:hypothetical protein
MYCNITKICSATSKNNIEKYILQHQKLCAATSKNTFCNISNSSTATSQQSTMKHGNRNIQKSSVATIQKIPLQHSKIICRNINKTHYNTEKQQRTYKAARGWIQVQVALALAHHLRVRRRKDGIEPQCSPKP